MRSLLKTKEAYLVPSLLKEEVCSLLYNSTSLAAMVNFEFQDSDVQAEAKRILSGSTNDDDVVVIKNLTKVDQNNVMAIS